MQFDHTHIDVRERSLLDNFDLALLVTRAYFRPLAIATLAGVLPLALLNHVLLSWIVLGDGRETFFYADDAADVARYVWLMSVLIVIQAPLGTVFATGFIGQALFVENPQLSRVFRDIARLAPRLIWCQLLLRGVLPAVVLVAGLERYGEFDPFWEIVLLGGLGMYVCAFRLWRPYLNEIIVLEKTPLFSRSPGALTISRRSRQLHGPSSGDLFFRGVTTAAIAACLMVAIFGTFLFAAGVLLNDWQPGPLMVAYMLPFSMWIVAGFTAVVRFLNYLDLRIRHEGWEVELRLRAEGERLARRAGAPT